jgi:hypothetical protein
MRDGVLASTMQEHAEKSEDGERGGKKVDAADGQKKNIPKTFKRRPRSEHRNDDQMQIDAKKKRLFSDDEDEDLEGAKRQKCAVDEEVRMPEPTLNAGLSEQSCEKQ